VRSLRIIIISAIIAIIAILLGYSVRSYYKFLKEPVASVINALPPETVAIITTENVFQLFNALNNSELSELLSTLDSYTTIKNYIDSISVNNSKLRYLLESKEVVFAFLPDKNEKLNLLLVIATGKTSHGNINKYLSNLTDSRGDITKLDENLYKLTYNQSSLWYYVHKGLFTLSTDSIFVTNSLKSLKSDNSIASNQSFIKLYNTGGKRVDANLIVNTKLMASSLIPKFSGRLEEGTPFDQWTSFDVNIKKSNVQLGGFTFTNSNHYFVGQEPVQFDELSSYPFNTGLGISLSLSNQDLYTNHFLTKDTIHVKGFDSSIGQQNIEIFNRKEHINAWIGNTVSLIYTEDYFKKDRSAVVVMIKHTNLENAKSYLKPYLEPLNDSINQLHFETLPSILWGSLFEIPGKLFCLITAKHVYLSPNKALLQKLALSSLLKGNNELRFAKESMGNHSNVFIFIRPDIIGKWILQNNMSSNNDLVNFISSNSSIGVQYSVGKDFQYTHAWINPKTIEVTKKVTKGMSGRNIESETSINSNADSKVSDRLIDMKDEQSTIQIVNGPLKNSKLIAVINKTGELRMFDHDGVQLWKYKSDSPLKQKLIEVDFYRNGKTQYIVSTDDKLHLIDHKGTELRDSPIILPKSAKSELFVFDYDNRRDYRVLYIASDNRIYNITLNGVELPDWQKPVVDGHGKIDFYRTHGKDYLVYKNNDNSIRIFDRRGRERIQVDKSLNLSKFSGLFANTTNSKGIFLSVSGNGDLVYIDSKGRVSKSIFGDFDTNPWFTYTDFDSDGSKDFIFRGNKKIVVYNRLKETITSKTTTGTFGIPFIYSSSAKDTWIFVRNISNNEIIGFNNNGRSYKNLSVTSDTDPIVFNPGGSHKELLITMKDNKIILIELEGL
jgi:hypothetical protein